MSDQDRPKDGGTDTIGADPDGPRGTVAPAVGGSKANPAEGGPEPTEGEPPTNAGGKTVNNPDIGPSS